MKTLLDALLAANSGHALVQFHDYDGSMLAELHALATERALPIEIIGGYRPSHEVRVGVISLVVHDMNDSWRPTEGAWSPAHHCAEGAVSRSPTPTRSSASVRWADTTRRSALRLAEVEPRLQQDA